MADQGGLSDALRQMADPKAPQPSVPHEDLPEGQVPVADGETGAPPLDDVPPIVEIDEPASGPLPLQAAEFEAPDVAGDPQAASLSPSAPAPRPPAHDHLKIAAVPVLLVVGTLLLVPGVWAVCMLLGYDMLMDRTPDAVLMAWVMLICWPIAAALLASGVVIFRQLRRGT